MKYCTAFELAEHNHEGSLWVAIFGNVLDVTALVAQHSGDETRAIVEAAGQDISHWFVKGPEGKVELKTYIHPITALPVPYLPWLSPLLSTPLSTASEGRGREGKDIPGGKRNTTIGKENTTGKEGSVGGVYPVGVRLLHAAAVGVDSQYSTRFQSSFPTPHSSSHSHSTSHSNSHSTSTDSPLSTHHGPWFQCPFPIARLTALPRKIKIINSLTSQEHILDVCGEESLNDIRNRYLEYNKHANSYAWKRLGVPLQMDKTLDENGIVDERAEMLELQVDDEAYIPAIHLYFIDDLTIA